jgi:tetraacyldisaccharide-1-P 4'-kinase
VAAPINLQMMDPTTVDQTGFGPDAVRWLANLVDIINAAFPINLVAVGQIDVGGAGAGPIVVTVTGINATNFVNVTLLSSSSSVTVVDVTPGTGQFTVTFSGDPGASAIIAYQVFIQNMR